ncbi:glutamine amidotransferase-like protein [Ameyamaea chiangmaiensis NBRC 103196]|uniref:Gamma-glutamyl-gamma-aminobutyrate hydrolase family protein n=1 Tax=Ameyamaea chiangmaiensis TaxID=442969 RepID=A0A850PHX6_9PROT|nr:gamma-glutamyl-gamma-aminobutyrate hydrolase family protein [Ameyamaea chiangmaiensis]MBS4075177.1 gamma-glutamyl-gamma-aminobutyrate hydrolase family protein [Ameyamaea chiangmaiensis]NVN41846.1 gamma-glutamyl-gamma-aminobutyrate hydrolase family protein [Ameyamaea chiangmaiensis]GBQ66318.1 glutamine amidotransferase-like protein [Ameyamaea chiangmaiensis NBRC 103196]
MHRTNPVIGVTLDSEPAGGWSAWPWYAIRTNYMDAIAHAGGVPVALPHNPRLAADMIAAVDALVVTGGAFDIDPALYGDATTHETVTLKRRRTGAELALLAAALERDRPVLGICGGAQLLGVALGGTLIQHIPDSVPDALPHEQPNPRDQAGHTIAITPGSRLADIVEVPMMAVNSSHHQAILDPGRAQVCARAEDGVIEAIEDPAREFCLGVQWHPEFEIDRGDRKIFAALVAAARRRQG